MFWLCGRNVIKWHSLYTKKRKPLASLSLDDYEIGNVIHIMLTAHITILSYIKIEICKSHTHNMEVSDTTIIDLPLLLLDSLAFQMELQ